MNIIKYLKMNTISSAYLALKEEGTVISSLIAIALTAITIINRVDWWSFTVALTIFYLFFYFYGKSRNYVYKKDPNIIAYFPLKTNFLNIEPQRGNAIPICRKYPNDIIIDVRGIKFNKYMFALAHIPSLPSGHDERSIVCWFRFAPEFDVQRASAHFICAFGSAKSAGRAFGLYYGSPQIEGHRDEPKGLRIFLYSTLDGQQGDSPPFYINKIQPGKWHYVGCSYSCCGKITLIAGDEQQDYEPKEIDIQINTDDSELLYIGQIPTEVGVARFPDNAKYLTLPISKWNFCGYIRELVVFNKYLSASEMKIFAHSLKKRIS